MNTNTTDMTQARMLSEARSNETVRVVKCHGGRGFKENLARLGVLPGVLLQVIAKGRSGPVIISCRGCRIAIGQGMAERIEVIRENAAT